MNQEEHTEAFLAFWEKLDRERLAKGEELAGFGEAWEGYRIHLIEEAAQRRFLEHAAYGERDA
ncbi:MAG: hypothetical protein ABWY78_04960 [Microvirga sp.]